LWLKEAELTSCRRLPPAGDEIKEQHDHGDNQKQVDQASTDMTNETEQPENDQHDDDGIKHGSTITQLSPKATGINPIRQSRQDID
jgi:hypothetical protein